MVGYTLGSKKIECCFLKVFSWLRILEILTRNRSHISATQFSISWTMPESYIFIQHINHEIVCNLKVTLHSWPDTCFAWKNPNKFSSRHLRWVNHNSIRDQVYIMDGWELSLYAIIPRRPWIWTPSALGSFFFFGLLWNNEITRIWGLIFRLGPYLGPLYTSLAWGPSTHDMRIHNWSRSQIQSKVNTH